MKPKTTGFHTASAPLKSLSFALTLAGAGIFLPLNSVQAASGTWNATATNGIWEATGAENNWSTGAATFPGAVGTTNNADIATFSSTSSTTSISINSTAGNISTLNLAGIAFTGSSLSASTIGSTSGNSLLFTPNNNTGGSDTPNANIYYNTSVNSLNQTINAPIKLQGNAFFSNRSSGTNSSIVINGAISGNTSGAFTLNLRGNGTSGQSNFINGNISNGSATSLAISTFAGPWTLAGSNSYNGLTTAGGLVTVTGTNSGGGAYTINSGGYFAFNTSGTIVASVVGSQSVSNTRGVTLTGGVTLQVNTDVGAAGSGNNFAPGLTFNNGTLKSGNASGITVDATTASTTPDHKATVQVGGATFDTTTGSINGVSGFFLSGTAAGAITVKGGNTLKSGVTNTGLLTIQDSSTWDINGIASSIAGLSGTNGSVTNSGAAQTLTLNFASGTQTFGGAVGGGANVAVTKTGAGTQVLSASNTYSGATTISTGALQLGHANAVQNSTVTISATNGLAFSTGVGTFNLGGLSGGSSQALTDTAAGAITLSVGANNASTTYSGVLSGLGGLTKAGSGSLSLTGINSYSGDTTVSLGTVSIGGAGQIGSGTYSGNISIASGALFEHASSAYTTVGGATNRITGLGSITKSGAGTLRIDSSQSFSGGVSLTQGVLEYNGASSLGTGTVTISAGEITARGAGGSLANNFVLNGDVQLGRSGIGAVMGFSGNFNLGGGARTITMNGTSIILSGTISNGGIAKSGASTLQLSNTGNTYAAGTVLNEGILEYSGSGALGSGTVTINGGELTARGAGGTLVNNFIINGDLQLGRSLIGSAMGISGNVDLGGGTRTFTLPGGVDVTVSGIISNGGLTKTGTSKLTLTGVNTYAGSTTVTGGTLAVNGDAIPNTGALVISGTGVVQPTGIEVVASLDLGSGPVAAGTYGATGSGATNVDNTHFVGTAGVIQVPSIAGSYTSWASNVDGQTAGEDFNKDGVGNGIAYFMNNTGRITLPSIVGGAVTWTNGGNIPASAYGTQFVVQTSQNLATWTNVLVGGLTTNTDSTLTYTLPTGQGKWFVRLVVTPN